MSLNQCQQKSSNKCEELGKFRKNSVKNQNFCSPINLQNLPHNQNQNQFIILSDGSTMSSSSAASINQNSSCSKLNDNFRDNLFGEQLNNVLPTEEDFKK